MPLPAHDATAAGLAPRARLRSVGSKGIAVAAGIASLAVAAAGLPGASFAGGTRELLARGKLENVVWEKRIFMP